MLIYKKSKKFQLGGAAPSSVKQYVPQSAGLKLLDIIQNPFTSMKQYMKYGYIPDNMGKAIDTGNMPSSPMDLPLSVLNPTDEALEVGSNLHKGKYGAAAATLAMYGVPAPVRKKIIKLAPDLTTLSKKVSKHRKNQALEELSNIANRNKFKVGTAKVEKLPGKVTDANKWNPFK